MGPNAVLGGLFPGCGGPGAGHGRHGPGTQGDDGEVGLFFSTIFCVNGCSKESCFGLQLENEGEYPFSHDALAWQGGEAQVMVWCEVRGSTGDGVV